MMQKNEHWSKNMKHFLIACSIIIFCSPIHAMEAKASVAISHVTQKRTRFSDAAKIKDLEQQMAAMELKYSQELKTKEQKHRRAIHALDVTHKKTIADLRKEDTACTCVVL